MDPITAAGIATNTVSTAMDTARVAVDEAQAARFADLVQANGAAGELAPIAPSPTLAGPTPGDAILNGMRNVGTEFRAGWDAMKAMLVSAGPEASVTDMLRMQLQMMQLSFQVEVVGKAVSRAGQNVDQLTKMQ